MPMQMDMGQDVLALLPEVFLVLGAVVTLLGGSFVPRSKQWTMRVVAVAALLGAGGAAAAGLAATSRTVMDTTFAVDAPTGAARLVVVTATLLVIGLGVTSSTARRGRARPTPCSCCPPSVPSSWPG
jgi:NADH-quinone oxidoreductase subunit N